MDSGLHWISVPVAPVFTDVAEQLATGLVEPTTKAGRKAAKAVEKTTGDMVQSLQRQIKASTAKLNEYYRDYQDSLKKAESQQHKLTAAISEQEAAEEKFQEALAKGKSGAAELAKLERAKAKVTDETIKMAEAERKIRDAEKKHEAQLKDLEKTTKKYEKAQDEAANTAKSSKKHFASLGDIMGDLSEKASSMGGPLGKATEILGSFTESKAAGFVAVAGAVTGAATAVGKFSEDLAQSRVSMQNEFGLTADAARDMQGEIADAMGSGLGTYEETAEVVGAIQQSLADNTEHMAGRTVADLADNFLSFAQTFGVEAAEATSLVDNMLNTGMVDSAQEGIDLLTAGLQKVPKNLQGEILDATSEYSKHFANMGLDGSEAMAMLVKASGQGQIAIDKVGDAVKEFSIRGSDMSKTSVEAYEQIGLNAEEMARKIAEGGAPAKEALEQTADGLLAIEDPAERANAAIALFGTPLEDVGVDQVPTFLEGLQAGRDGMGDFADASQEMADNTENTFTGMVNRLKGTTHGLAIDAANALNEWAGNVTTGIGNMVSSAWDALGMDTLIDNVENAAGEITGIFSGDSFNAEALTELFGSDFATEIVGWLSWAGAEVRNLCDQFIETWDAISPVLEQVYDYLAGNLGEGLASLWDALTSIGTAVWDIVSSLGGAFLEVLGAVWDILSPLLVPILKVLGGLLGGTLVAALGAVSEAFKIVAKVIEVAAGVIEWLSGNVISPLITAIGDLAGILGDVLGAAMEWIGDKFSWLGDRLVDIWGWIDNVVFAPFRAAAELLSGDVEGATGVITGAFDYMKDTLSRIGMWIIEKVFGDLGTGIETLQGWFNTGTDAIHKIWDGLREATAAPIRFVVNTVLNSGLLKGIEAVAKLIPGLDAPAPIQLGFATGGILPGYTPGSDVYDFIDPRTGLRIGLSGGEAIIRPEATRVLGSDWVDGINAAAKVGGRDGVMKFLGGFANGGIIDSIVGMVKANFPEMTITSTFRPGDPGHHGAGKAVDFSNGFDTTPQMERAAQWFYENYGAGLLELIHSPFNNNVKNGQNVGDGFGFYGAGIMSQHRNHVHVAAPAPLGDPSIMVEQLTEGTAGGPGFSLREMVASAFNKIVEPIIDAIPDFGGGFFGHIPAAFANWAVDQIREFLGGAADTYAPAGGTVGNVESWREMAMAAMRRNGFNADDPAQVTAMLKQIQSESGGDPNIAQQIVDVNGTGESAGVGLLQIIPGTFAANRDPELPNDRRDPWANMNAALRYYKGRYGTDLTTMWGHGHGYADGGILPRLADLFHVFDTGGILRNGQGAVNLSGADEVILNAPQLQVFGALTQNLGLLVNELRATGDVGMFVDGVKTAFAPWMDPIARSLDPTTDEGVIARRSTRRILDLGIDIPSSDVITAVLDGENDLWASRERQLGHLNALAEKEQALEKAREALAKLENANPNEDSKSAEKIEKAEKALEKAKAAEAEAESEEKRSKAAEKTAEAEKKLAEVREDAEKDSEKNAEKHAENVKKAQDDVAKAEQDLASERKAQVQDLDSVIVASRQSIEGVIPSVAHIGGLGDVLQGIANAVGDAGISLGTVFDAVKTGVNVVKTIVTAIMDLVEKIHKARVAARQGLADAWDTIARYSTLMVDANANVASLQQALIRSANEQRAAEFALRVAVADRIVAQAEGITKIAEARVALDEELEKSAKTAHLKLTSLYEDWDSYNSYAATNFGDVVTEWSDTAIAKMFAYEATRAEAVSNELKGRVEQIKAEFALAAATRKNSRAQEDLLTAQERLIRMSAKAAGVDLEEATGWAQASKLITEMFELQKAMDKNVFGRWGYQLGDDSSYANAYRGQMAQMNALKAAFAEVQEAAGISVSDADLKEMFRQMTLVAMRNGPVEDIIRARLPQLAEAEKVLKTNEALDPIWKAHDKVRDTRRGAEDAGAEVAEFEQVTPLEETIKALGFASKSLDASAKAWAAENKRIRGAYMGEASANRDMARRLGVEWQLDDSFVPGATRDRITREEHIYMDGEKIYTADQVDKLLAKVTKGSNVGVITHYTASEVAGARRRELV